jgi:hypothetical protein
MTVPVYKPGQFGTIFVNDTNPVEGNFWAIEVIAAAVFTTLTDRAAEYTHGAIAAVSFAANAFIVGDFKLVTLASGTVRLHKCP